jgi:tRNA modification GTPase
MKPSITQPTIVAQASAVGSAGIGVIRLSGADALAIAKHLLRFSKTPRILPRQAHFVEFIDRDQQLIDQGLVLYFPAPHSFTGEDVVELQAHGAQVVLQQLIATSVHFGAQLAKPGEFSQRAFLNGKLDLLQAEAIADLIAASSARAARAALQSLTGVFSVQIHQLADRIKTMRVQIEAAIDFSDEAIETHALQSLELKQLCQHVKHLMASAQKGLTLNQGVRIGLVGKPNVGKSRLMNALLGYDRAMVTAIAGTTRDTLQESFHIEGVRFEIVDTAGLHNSDDALEQEGMRRTRQALATCDWILVVQDIRQPESLLSYLQALGIDQAMDLLLPRCIGVRNKSDLLITPLPEDAQQSWLVISAEQGHGLEQLAQHLLARAQLQHGEETPFMARRRHLLALQKVVFHLQAAEDLLAEQVLDLLAEELRLAHHHLGEMVGTFSSDDLLGEIFSTFCIGK